MNLIMLKPIRDGRYAVNAAGDVYSLIRRAWKCTVSREAPYKMQQYENSSGYFRVQIDGKMELVHRIILEAYRGLPPSDAHVCDHIDNNRKNNHISNLQWITRSQNAFRRQNFDTDNRGTKCPTARLKKEDILVIISDRKRGLTQGQLARKYKVSSRVIWSLLNGRTYKQETAGLLEGICQR